MQKNVINKSQDPTTETTTTTARNERRNNEWSFYYVIVFIVIISCCCRGLFIWVVAAATAWKVKTERRLKAKPKAKLIELTKFLASKLPGAWQGRGRQQTKGAGEREREMWAGARLVTGSCTAHCTWLETATNTIGTTQCDAANCDREGVRKRRLGWSGQTRVIHATNDNIQHAQVEIVNDTENKNEIETDLVQYEVR